MMKFVLRFSAVALVAALCTSVAQTQDPTEAPQYGTVTLKAGFDPDPVVVKVEAGGEVKTKLGGFEHWVGRKPDVRLNYEAGKYIMSIYVECAAETTLLINLPNEKWIGVNAGPGKTPILRFDPPLTGQYDIWVGTPKSYEKDFPPAKLCITELKK